MATFVEIEIGELVDRVRSWNPATDSNENDFTYIDLSSVDKDSKSIVNPVRTLCSEAPSRARQLVSVGDILVSTVRPNLNGVAVVKPEFDGATASTGFCVLRPKKETLFGQYLYHWVRSPAFIRDMTQKATGASYPAVSDRIIRDSKIPLPTMLEQMRIAVILDKADDIRRKRETQLTEIQNLIEATFYKMFGHPENNRYGWKLMQFSDACDSRLGKMLDAKQQTGSHARHYLRNLNVHWCRLDLSDMFQMDFDAADREEFRLQYGDVLICEGGAGVGQTAIWRDELKECYFQKSLHRVRPKPDLAVPEFIQYLMWALMQGSSLLNSISTATIPHLTGVRLKSIQIPVPPIDLQRKFQAIVLRHEALRSRLEQASVLDNSLFQSLVQRAFKGEL